MYYLNILTLSSTLVDLLGFEIEPPQHFHPGINRLVIVVARKSAILSAVPTIGLFKTLEE